MIEYDAVIPAGGRGSRLGGVDKPSLVVGGMSLADRAVASVVGARRVVLVGHGLTPSSDPCVRVARETPRWSGPVASIEAGLAAIGSSALFTVVLAADLPSAAPAVTRLLALAGDATADGSRAGVVAVAGGGIRQPLLAVYRSDRLRAAVAAVVESAGRSDGRGASMREVLERMPLLEAEMPEEWCRDLDTPADAAHFGVTLPAPGTRETSADDG